MIRSEAEIRQMLKILEAFNSNGVHDTGIMALRWTLGEYPPEKERTEDNGEAKVS